MHKIATLTTATWLVIAALTTVTLLVVMGESTMAEDDNGACRSAQQNHLISANAMAKKIQQLGYDVRRFKVDTGCFKARIIEHKTGGVVDATFSRANGQLLGAKPVL